MTQTSQTNKIQNQNENEKGNENIVNGISVTKLVQTVGAIQDNPEIANFNLRAKGRWIDGGHNQTTVNEFYGACQTHRRSRPFVYDEDEPPVLLGEDHGANAGEYALVALSSCLTTTLIYHAAAQGISIDEVETTLSGDVDLRGFLGLDENVRNGYEIIKVDFRVKSNAPREKIKELVELAQKRSPVFDMLSHPTPVEVSLRD